MLVSLPATALGPVNSRFREPPERGHDEAGVVAAVDDHWVVQGFLDRVPEAHAREPGRARRGHQGRVGAARPGEVEHGPALGAGRAPGR